MKKIVINLEGENAGLQFLDENDNVLDYNTFSIEEKELFLRLLQDFYSLFYKSLEREKNIS